MTSRRISFTEPGGFIDIRLEQIDQCVRVTNRQGEGHPEFLPFVFEGFGRGALASERGGRIPAIAVSGSADCQRSAFEGE